jgi:hypothetical protein
MNKWTTFISWEVRRHAQLQSGRCNVIAEDDFRKAIKEET